MQRVCGLFVIAFFLIGIGAPARAQQKLAYFLVQVQNERFVLAVLDARALQDATDCLEGRKRLIPTGEVAPGDGGFNAGWGWHLKPETVRFAEVAMEVCDGKPSDVGNITSRRYCPWTARIVRNGCRTGISACPGKVGTGFSDKDMRKGEKIRAHSDSK